MTNTYRMKVTSLASGRFAARWFDDETLLWEDERLYKAVPIRGKWRPPVFRLRGKSKRATPVLFNPDALAVSDAVRRSLSEFDGIEFLPIEVRGHGTYFVLHVLCAVASPAGSLFQTAPPPSGNIVEFYSFPPGFSPPGPFFRLLHPRGSAAARFGFCFSSIFVSDVGARAIRETMKGFLDVVPVTQG